MKKLNKIFIFILYFFISINLTIAQTLKNEVKNKDENKIKKNTLDKIVTPLFAANIGYNYFGKGENTGYLGADLRCNSKYKPPLNVGLGSFITYENQKIVFYPTVHINYSINNYMLVEIASSNYFFKPSIGFNTANAVQFKLGYVIGYQKEKNNVISFGIHVNFGSKNFYDYIKLSW